MKMSTEGYERTPHISGDMGATGLATTSEEVSSTKFENFEQIFHRATKYEKLKILSKLVKANGGTRILIFLKTNPNADSVSTMLCQQKMVTSFMLGDRVRSDTKLARENIKNGNQNILVATSAANIGPGMRYADIVIDYDCQKTIDESMDRIKRTESVGHRDKSILFFGVDQEEGLTGSLAEALRLADQPLPDILRDIDTSASQNNDSAVVKSEVSTPHLLQSPETRNSTNDGGHQLLMTPHGPMVHWCCTCSECSS